MVSAAAVLEAELADVDVGALVDDGLADHDGGVLLAEAPGHMDGDLRLGIEGVDHEAVAGVDDLLVSQIQHDHLVIDLGDAQQLRLERLGFFEIEVHALLDIRQLQDLVDIVVEAVVYELHHQLIVGDAEIVEAAEAGARVHQIVQQHPALGVQDLIQGEIGAVALVHGRHQIIGDAGEGFFSAVIVIHHAGCAAGGGVDDELAVGFRGLQAVHLGFMVVEGDGHPGVIGQVRGNIVFGELDLAVLHVLGVHEFDLVDELELLEHHGAGQTVKITSRDKSSYLLFHWGNLLNTISVCLPYYSTGPVCSAIAFFVFPF